MTVVNDRFSFISIPAVQLHTAAALIQSPDGDKCILRHKKIIIQQQRRGEVFCSVLDVRLSAAGAGDLVLGQVGVV